MGEGGRGREYPNGVTPIPCMVGTRSLTSSLFGTAWYVQRCQFVYAERARPVGRCTRSGRLWCAKLHPGGGGGGGGGGCLLCLLLMMLGSHSMRAESAIPVVPFHPIILSPSIPPPLPAGGQN